MNITYLGHNSLFLKTKNQKIIVDPAISINPLASHIKIQEFHADYMLITHAHGDHIADVDAVIQSCNPLIISNYEIATYYSQKGYKTHPMNHGGRKTFEFGTIAITNAIHSSVFPDGSSGGNPAGFVLTSDGKSIYIAGDTALTYDMKLIPLLYPPLDLAILPIGDNFTMGIEDSIVAAQFLKCKQVLGCHYDTFPPIQIDHDEARKKYSDAGLNLTLLNPGQSLAI